MNQQSMTVQSATKTAQDFIRPANERGWMRLGWLDSRHSFSFGHYYDPQHMGLSVLRVINDDTVAPGAGFETHAHRDMEIITYVLEGAIKHKDSMGNAFTLRAGEVQRMSAGTGILHSEFNASSSEPLKFLQIWIVPDRKGLEPGYEQANIEQSDTLTPLVTPDGRKGSLTLHQNVLLSRLRLNESESHSMLLTDRVGYLHVIQGQAQVNDHVLGPGDALGVLALQQVSVMAKQGDFEALWFELPKE